MRYYFKRTTTKKGNEKVGKNLWIKWERRDVSIGEVLLGRALDALGNPIDGKGRLSDVT